MAAEQHSILLLFAHPSLHRSEVNVHLLQASREVSGVTVVDLYAEYPNYHIDITREQDRLRSHDVVIFMFPLYWYSTPALLKEWQDLVLEYGFAYGSDGTALHGKLFLCAVTAGGAEDAYCTDGYNHFTLRELLTPLEQTATLTGMRYLAPYALFGSRTALEEGRIDSHVSQWQQLLEALRDGKIDLQRASTLSNLKNNLDSLTSAPA
ncbi:MAG: NAD(P)H-dependent oxidoreductase [Pseudomonadota bacterium]